MSATAGNRGPAGSGQESRSRWPRLDWFDWCCLAGTALLSMAVLGPLLATGRIPSGADGVFPVDQLQYLTWIRQASQHWLIGNEFDMLPDSRVFLHPGFLLSGLLHRWTGVSLQVAYAGLWKPVSVLVVFAGAFLYTRRMLVPVWPRRIGLLLAIFALVPWSAFIKWTGIASKPTNFAFDFFSGEMWTGQFLQGYSMTAIAVFLVPIVLLVLEKARNGQPRLAWVGALGALIVMWLQPWQGAQLLIIVGLVEGWRWWRQGERPWLGFLPVFILGSLPAVYYWLLSRYDYAWKLAGQSNAVGESPLWNWPWWMVVISLLPLGLPAALAYRARDNDWQGLAVRFWPFAIWAVYFIPLGTFPYHSMQGLSIPLAVLAVQGMTLFRPARVPAVRAWWLVPFLVVMIVPGTIHKAWNSYDSHRRVAYPWYLEPGDRDALRFLETDQRPGGVLTDDWSGLLIPPYTGREPWVGTFSWTPDSLRRLVLVTSFLNGKSFLGGPADPAGAQAFLKTTGTRFIFQPCKGTPDGRPLELDRLIGGSLEERRDFGCARVYVLKPNPVSDRVSRGIGGAAE